MLKILTGDAVEQLRTLEAESVHCCCTSPPYWGLRDYGTAQWEGGDDGCDHQAPAGVSGGQRADRTFTLGEIYKTECGKCGAKRIDSQLGLEKTPEGYVAKMVEVFREVRRVLRKDGTLWLNLGGSYNNRPWGESSTNFNDPKRGKDNAGEAVKSVRGVLTDTLKPKDLCGIPWRVVLALQKPHLKCKVCWNVSHKDQWGRFPNGRLICPSCEQSRGSQIAENGWWLRSDIIWAKPNPMPESVTDRPTKAHEYLFLLTKSANYFYDAEAIREDGPSYFRKAGGYENPEMQGCYDGRRAGGFRNGDVSTTGRNKRSVWTVATAPYPEAHFATYPPDLIKPCIMAGTSAKGCCAKCGSPWERIVEKGESSWEARKAAGHTTYGLNPPQSFDTPKVIGRKNEGGLGWVAESKTIGWQPTCKCESGIEPCTCVDPFAGSGTTGAVALELGRKAILIELNPKYVELIKQRCNVTMGLALA